MNASATDKQVGRMFEAKQQDEASVLYPDGFDFTEREGIPPNQIDDTQRVDYKKSLTQTLEEDSDIDYRRTVDSSVGAAALHEFIPATKLKGMEDWIPESDHYKYYNSTADFPLKIEMEDDFVFPDQLNIFTYEQGNVSTFIKPKRSVAGVFSHFLMDGASVLPPLALAIQPGDRVLDACAAPGGKSLAMLQTLYPEFLVSNDVQTSRVERMNRVLNDYLTDYEDKWKNKRCLVTDEDARVISEYGIYDKVCCSFERKEVTWRMTFAFEFQVLVDVPCTTDRHSVMENDNNIFKSTRLKERLRIPELQSAILSNCIKLLKPGGSLVYSTCSLSPVQNDGVVHMALSRIFTESNVTVTIK